MWYHLLIFAFVLWSQSPQNIAVTSVNVVTPHVFVW